MSKNMTQRSLAVGAGLSLVAAGMTATVPAFAADDIVIKPAAGSATNFNGTQALSATTGGFLLDLNTGLSGATAIAGGSADAADYTKYVVEIVNDDVTFGDIYDDNDLSTRPATAVANSDIMFYTGGAGTSNSSPVKFGSSGTPDLTDTKFIVDGANTIAQELHIVAAFSDGDATTVTDTLNLKITPFLDLDNDNRNDDSFDGNAVTVSLIGDSGVTFTPAFDFVELGDTAITGTVNSNVNLGVYQKVTLENNPEDSGSEELALSLISDITGASRVSTELALSNDATPVGLQADIGALGGTSSAATLAITVSDEVQPLLNVGDFVSLSSSSTLTDGTTTMLDTPFEILSIGSISSGTATVTVDVEPLAHDGTVTGTEANVVVHVSTLDYDSTNDEFDFTFSASQVDNASGSTPTAVAAGKYTAEVFFNGAQANIENTSSTTVGSGAKFTNNSDSEVAKTFAAKTADHLDIILSQGAQNDTGTATTLLATNTAEVLPGTKALDFTIQVWTDSAETTPAGSGIDVQVTLTDASDDLGTTTLTSEGKTLKSTGVNSVTFTKTTDSSGQIEFTVAADNGVAGESFKINASAEGVGTATSTAQTVKFEKEDFDLLQTPDTNLEVAPSGSIAVDYRVVNQFGDAPSGNFQLAVTRAAASGDTRATADEAEWSYVVPVSDTGRATVTITDNGIGEGVDTVTVTLQEAATAGGGYLSTGDTDTFDLTYESDFSSLSATAVANYNGVKKGSTALYPVKLEPDTLVDYDGRVDVVAPDYDADNAFTNKTDTTVDELLKISGKVTDADNDPVSGVAVKVSAAGMNFATADSLTEAQSLRMLNDSIVVTTNVTGDYEVFVRSAVSGKQSISVDAQGATASVDVTFEGSTGNADSMTLDLASSVVDGRTADVKATVVDAFDNPVAGVTVTFKEEGPGYLNTATGTTDAEGEVIVNLITLSGDTGTSTISATATIDGESTTVTDTITVGTVAAEQKVNAGSFKGYVAVYARGYEGSRLSTKIGKDWIIVEEIVNNEGANLYRLTDFTGAGVDIAVRIYIDRVLVDTINLTTK